MHEFRRLIPICVWLLPETRDNFLWCQITRNYITRKMVARFQRFNLETRMYMSMAWRIMSHNQICCNLLISKPWSGNTLTQTRTNTQYPTQLELSTPPPYHAKNKTLQPSSPPKKLKINVYPRIFILFISPKKIQNKLNIFISQQSIQKTHVTLLSPPPTTPTHISEKIYKIKTKTRTRRLVAEADFQDREEEVKWR